MKVTVRQLRRIISEEVHRVLTESEGNQIHPSELKDYKWVTVDGVEGTFDLDDVNNKDYASGMKKIGDGTNKAVTLVPRSKPINYASVKETNGNYFVGDTDGLVRYFKEKMYP